MANPVPLGSCLTTNGYVLVRVDMAIHGVRWKREHRLVMEKILHRFLKRSEIVHHRNGVRADNRPENLAVMQKRTHDRYHFLNPTDETRRKQSDRMKRLWQDPDYRARATASRRKEVQDPAFLKRRGEAIKKARSTMASKLKTAAQANAQWADPEWRKAQMPVREQAMKIARLFRHK